MKHRKSSSSSRRWAFSGLGSPDARRRALIAFVILVAATGGSSRGDVLSLAILRPAAVLFGAYALLTAPAGSLSGVRGWLALLGSVALVVALQLVPLPPALWHALPKRESVVAVDALLGLEQQWRPLALAPEAAWNALFSLIVPATAMLLFAGLEPVHRKVVGGLWLGVALVSAFWGLAQLLGIDALYTYATTNRGMPVGLFANANHQAAFLAASIPLLAFYGTREEGQSLSRAVMMGLAMVLFVIVILLTGSRAGMALGVICFGLALLATVQHLKVTASSQKSFRPVSPSARAGPRLRAGALIAGGAAFAFGAAVTLLIASKGVAGMTSTGGAEAELRVVALPTILTMLQRGWAFGFGAGSFPAAFQLFEPTSLLSRYYLNHAHNDWLEPVLDLGVAGAALMIGLLLLVARACYTAWLSRGVALSRRMCLIAPVAVFAAASLVDYPLRTPIVQVLGLLWLAALGAGEVIRNDPIAKR